MTDNNNSSNSRIKILNERALDQVELLDVATGKERINGRLVVCNGRRVEHINERKALELGKKLEELKEELSHVKINPGHSIDKIKVLMYLYGKLQREIKYSNPAIMLGRWNPYINECTGEFENIMNSYGALVDNYALCSGISEAMLLACQYFGIECKVLDSTNGTVRHATNLATINGKQIHFDLASEIGMGEDGRYISKEIKRIVQKEKTEVTYNYFGRTKSEITSRFEDNNVPEGIKMPQELLGKFKKCFFEHNRQTTGKIRIIEEGFDKIVVPKEFREAHIQYR